MFFLFLLNRISELTGLYFFSALLQADAAILGILGVFIIFRFQSIPVLLALNLKIKKRH